MLDSALSPFLLHPNIKECELPCTTSADCAASTQHCQNGSCSPNLCNEMLIDGGIVGPAAWQICDAAGTGDGTCTDTRTAVLDGNQNTLLSSFLCVQGGTSDGGCVADAGRGDPSLLCAAGLFCEGPWPYAGLDAGLCRQGCAFGTGADTCPQSQRCGSDSVCHDIGAGGCLVDVAQDTFPCAVDADCACPRHCRPDPGLGVNRCEESCTTSTDCSLDDDHCVGGLCVVNFCAADMAGNTAPGTYGQACDALDGGDGNCIAVGFEGGSPQSEFGVCLRAGSAGDSCAVPFNNQAGGFASFALVTFPMEIGQAVDATSLCPVGEVCAFADAGLACTAICDPVLDGGGTCSTGTCIEQGGDPIVDLGACLSCLEPNQGCSFSSECCSGSCKGQCE